jgi:acyl dehydratase
MAHFPQPLLVTAKISRLQLAYMTVAMRDPNLVHMEDEYAKLSGLPQVIAHGTFAVSYVGAALSNVVGVDNIKRLKVDLTAPVFPGDTITVQVLDVEQEGETTSATLTAVNQSGAQVARGTATWVTPDSH